VVLQPAVPVTCSPFSTPNDFICWMTVPRASGLHVRVLIRCAASKFACRFEHEGNNQSLAFLCCANSSGGALLPRSFWQSFQRDVASPRSQKLPDGIFAQCARLVSRVSRHHGNPLIVSCECSRFFWQPSPLSPVRGPTPAFPFLPPPFVFAIVQHTLTLFCRQFVTVARAV
jgi:hypothetical protein